AWARASCRYWTWPACSTSKQPLVNATRWPRARRRSSSRASSGQARSLLRSPAPPVVAWSKSRSISSRVTVATPIFSTSSPPAQLGAGFQRLGRAHQGAPRGQARLEAVGGDGRAAVVLAVVPPADRVAQGADPNGAGTGEEGSEQGGGADALVVVADEDHVG